MNPYLIFVLLPSYFGKIRHELRSERTQKNEDGDMDSFLAVVWVSQYSSSNSVCARWCADGQKLSSTSSYCVVLLRSNSLLTEREVQTWGYYSSFLLEQETDILYCPDRTSSVNKLFIIYDQKQEHSILRKTMCISIPDSLTLFHATALRGQVGSSMW